MDIFQLKKELTESDTVKKIILDTDTYNEIDDQYALAYALLASDRVEVLSVNAAPFFNRRSLSPGDGMEKSYREIRNVVSRLNLDGKVRICRGSEEFLKDSGTPVPSEAADSIVRTVLESKEPVYIVSIGAITNVASAILQCPELVSRAAVIWLGGVGFDAPVFPEFNLKQDIAAANAVFDSGIPLVQIPTFGVSSELITTVPEMQFYLQDQNPVCDYLLQILKDYAKDTAGWSKVIWDIANIGLLTVPQAYDLVLRHVPRVQKDLRYSFDSSRPLYLYVRRIRRDEVFGDLIRTLTGAKGEKNPTA